MTIEKLESGLLVAVDPNEQKKRDAEAYRAKWAAYDKLHVRCPRCGERSCETTCMGFVGLPPKDMNYATCCTKGCGWRGYVDDMIAEGVESARERATPVVDEWFNDWEEIRSREGMLWDVANLMIPNTR